MPMRRDDEHARSFSLKRCKCHRSRPCLSPELRASYVPRHTGERFSPRQPICNVTSSGLLTRLVQSGH
eukprot:696496-Lingulodinium_polyedra.AAC.1